MNVQVIGVYIIICLNIKICTKVVQAFIRRGANTFVNIVYKCSYE